MEIKEVDWGIANNFGDVIEINRNLKLYPEMYRAVLHHELKHTDKTFTGYDLIHDISDTRVKTLDILMFMFNHPKSLTQFIPFYWNRRYGFVYDINLIIVYIVFILIMVAGFYIGMNI